MTKWGHDELAHDLGLKLSANQDLMIWENMQMGPSGSARPDVYSIPKSYSKFTPISYEIKVSVSDFRSDVTAGKWQKYLKFSAGVVFAVPEGLINKADVPANCGLMVRGENGWRTLKKPTMTVVDSLPHDVWMKLLIDGVNRTITSNSFSVRSSNKWIVERKLREKYGDKIGLWVSATVNFPDKIKYEEERQKKALDDLQKRYQEERDQYKKSINDSMSELAVALGLNPDSDHWKITNAIKDAARRLNKDKEIIRLNNALDRIKSTLDDALKPIPGNQSELSE